jgi:hypothetical protein
MDPPQASIADAYHLDQRDPTETDHHMNRLDQPVHGALEQASLRKSKDRENEHIYDTSGSKQAHTPAEQLYETQGQKREGEGDAHHHMREDEGVVRGKREQPFLKCWSYSGHMSDPDDNAGRGEQEQPSQKRGHSSSHASDPNGNTHCDNEKTSFF